MEKVIREMCEIFEILSIDMYKINYSMFKGIYYEHRNSKILTCSNNRMFDFQKGDIVKRNSTREIFIINDIFIDSPRNVIKIYLDYVPDNYYPIVWARRVVEFIDN